MFANQVVASTNPFVSECLQQQGHKNYILNTADDHFTKPNKAYLTTAVVYIGF